MQSKTSVTQPTKMADNVIAAENMHQQELLVMCSSPKSGGVFIQLLVLLGR